MSGFESPNYTQVPNDFFDMIPGMSDAELRVALVMIRQTFGFHREDFKMGINELADAAGLSRNGTKDGAEKAELRGIFRRSNPDAQTKAEWELVVGQPVTPWSASDHPPGQPVTTPPSPSDQQVGVKERIKKSLNKKEGASAETKATDIPELVLYKEIVEHFPKKSQRQIVIESIQKVNNRLGRSATKEDLSPFWNAWCKVSGNEWSLVWLDEWAVSGKISNSNGKPPAPSVPQGFSVSQSWLQKKQAEIRNG